jgi:hypothetical protein
MFGIPEKVASNGYSIAIFTVTISATWWQPENNAEVFALSIRNAITSDSTKERVT